MKTSMFTQACLALVALASSAPSASAQQFSNQLSILPDDGSSFDSFGWSVDSSLTGQRFVVSAVSDSQVASSAGSAYVFVRSGDSWVQEAKLTPAGLGTGDFFGESVAIDATGVRVVIGTLFDDDNGSNAGAVYVFRRTGSVWQEEAKLLASDGTSGDAFGVSVAISGDGGRILVGAESEDTNGSDAGAAYVFQRTGFVWAEESKLLPAVVDGDDRFGGAVALDQTGDLAVSTASRHDALAFNGGSAYVYRRTAGVWNLEQELNSMDVDASDFFGESVAVSADGSAIAIGAQGDSANGINSGAAYVFRNTGTWNEVSKLLADDGAGSHFLGGSIAINSTGDLVLSGARGAPGGAVNNAGAAYVFVEGSGGGWSQARKLSATMPSNGDQFGNSVALNNSGDEAFVGVEDDDDNGNGSGSVRAFLSDDLEVPAEYGTLQAAISEAVNGDLILVGPGTYNENVDFSGKEITLRSTNGPAATVIQGVGGTVVSMKDGEAAGAILEGFTITGGTGQLGAGMRMAGGTTGQVVDCVFTGNFNTSRGGGLEVDQASSPRIEACLFTGNGSVRGGGLSIGPNCDPSVSDCRFENNTASIGGGAVFAGVLSDANFERCEFLNNTATGTGVGGGLLFDGASSGILANSLLFGNSADSGGAVSILLNANPKLVNCTVVENDGVSEAGGVRCASCNAELDNNIVYFNRHAGGVATDSQIFANGSNALDVSHCAVEGGWAGVGSNNIASDPGLINVESDWRLRIGSACIDAGDSGAVSSATDLDGLPRFVDDPDTSDTGSGPAPLVDIGALEFTGACSGSAPYVYCEAKVNSLGCMPEIDFTGSSSVADNDFVIVAREIINFRNGLLFYGFTGPASLPFQGGILCVQPPLRRTTIQNSFGNPPPTLDCSGMMTLDFADLIAVGSDPFLVVGQQINAQWWTRDPASSSGSGLSDGLEFEICP